MAKKKNQGKKHKFKYADPMAAASSGSPASGQNGAPATSAGQAAPTVAGKPRQQVAAAGTTRDFSYVAQDLRRIAILAVVLVGIEVAMWLLFSHTGLGNQVYNLVKV